jgi:intraflagellar transport protein 52
MNIPPVLNLYRQMSLPHQILALVPPEFEVPLPSAKFAVFPPQFRELPKPHLELFDLEEEFASERVALIKTD